MYALSTFVISNRRKFRKKREKIFFLSGNQKSLLNFIKMDSVSRLAISFTNTLSLGRRKKRSSSSPSTSCKTEASPVSTLSSSSHSPGKNAPCSVVDYKVEGGMVYFLTEDHADLSSNTWVDARDAIRSWPSAVLDFYLSSLSFGEGGGDHRGSSTSSDKEDIGEDGGWWRPTEAIRGLRESESEEMELQLIGRLLKVRRNARQLKVLIFNFLAL